MAGFIFDMMALVRDIRTSSALESLESLESLEFIWKSWKFVRLSVSLVSFWTSRSRPCCSARQRFGPREGNSFRHSVWRPGSHVTRALNRWFLPVPYWLLMDSTGFICGFRWFSCSSGVQASLVPFYQNPISVGLMARRAWRFTSNIWRLMELVAEGLTCQNLAEAISIWNECDRVIWPWPWEDVVPETYRLLVDDSSANYFASNVL